MKLTPWFDGADKPVRDGVYQRKYRSGYAFYCLYKNCVWYCPGSTVEFAEEILTPSNMQELPWRGVLK